MYLKPFTNIILRRNTMKKKRSLLLTLLFLLIFTLPVFAAAKKQTIKKAQKSITLTAGTLVNLKVKDSTKVKWTLKKTSLFQLTAKGLLKANKAGSGKITYKIGAKKYTLKLIIKKKAVATANTSTKSSGSGTSSGSRSTTLSSQRSSPSLTAKPAAALVKDLLREYIVCSVRSV